MKVRMVHFSKDYGDGGTFGRRDIENLLFWRRDGDDVVCYSVR